jgi:hypothetical protein
MKISKALLQAIAVAISIGTASTSCTKEPLDKSEEHQEKKKEKTESFNCLACGMG